MTSEITTEEIDLSVAKMASLKSAYEEAKRLSNDAHAHLEVAKAEVLTLLQKAGKSKYHVDGLGTVSVVGKAKVRVPKDPSDKKAMLDYFASKGEEVFNQTVTVNYNSLNSWYNQELEQDPLFRMPGVESPKPEFQISFRAK